MISICSGGRDCGVEALRGYLESENVHLWLLDEVSVGWLWLLGVASAFLVLAIWRFGRASEDRPTVFLLEPFLFVLVLAKTAQLAYYGLASTWPLGRWYHYYLPPVLALCVAIVAAQAFDVLGSRRRLARLASVGVVLLLGVHLVRTSQWQRSRDVEPRSNYKTHAVGLAERLHRVTPPDSVFAMGDRAGSLAYLLERPLIQTEGLVNSTAFLHALAAGQVHRFLREQGVDYVVFSGGERPQTALVPAAGRPGCWRFVEPKFGRGPKFSVLVCDGDQVDYAELLAEGSLGGLYGVWRYRPELQANGLGGGEGP